MINQENCMKNISQYQMTKKNKYFFLEYPMLSWSGSRYNFLSDTFAEGSKWQGKCKKTNMNYN